MKELIEIQRKLKAPKGQRNTFGNYNYRSAEDILESVSKKGMDESQITGTASSYARKYALNGLFCIDDTKDADTDAYEHQQNSARKEPSKLSKDELIDKIVALCDAKRLRVSDICKTAKVNELTDLTKERLEGCIEWIESI